MLAFPRSAAAQGEPFVLDWAAPSDCPDPAQVRAALTRLVATGEPTARRLHAEARVQQAGDSEYVLSLRTELDGVAGERILRGHACAMLSDAAVLTLALMLNPDTDIERAAPTTINPMPTPISRGTLRLSPASRFELGDPKASLRLQLSTQCGLATGILPRIGPEFGLGIGVAWKGASLGLDVALGPTQQQTLPGSANMGGRLWSGDLSLAGCWMFRTQGLAAGPCVGGAVTRVAGEGYGVRHPQAGSVVWFSPLMAARFELRMQSRVSLRLMVAALVPVDRPNVYFDDLGTVHRPASLDGRAQIGAVFDLR